MPAQLTERQNQIYEFIRRSLQQRGLPPTVQEIGTAVKLKSPNSVHKHLRSLEKKGLIVRTPNVARGIRPVDLSPEAHAVDDEIPSVQRIHRSASSEQPHLVRRGRRFFQLDPTFFTGTDPDGCLVGVAGDDGMADEGIYKGDHLLIEEADGRPLPSGPGRLAAVFIGETLVVRVVEVESATHHRLVPAATGYSPRSYRAGSADYAIVGPVLAVLRLRKGAGYRGA